MTKMSDKQIKLNRIENNFKNFMNKKGLNDSNISEGDLKEFVIDNLSSINRSAFYNQLSIFKSLLDNKHIPYKLEEKDLVEECVYFDNSKYFKKTQILDMLNLLINAQDKLMIYLIFNGILGKGYKELINIKVSDVAKDYTYINVDGNKILCDDIMKELLKDTIEQEVYVQTTKSGNTMYYDFNMNNEFLFKPIVSRTNNNGLDAYNRNGITRKLLRLTEELQHEGLNVVISATGLFQSGIMHKLFVFSILNNLECTINNVENYLKINGYRINANEFTLKYHQLYYGCNSTKS
jgi:hypothetical protein